MTLTFIDGIIIVVYFISILIIGFFIAGRSVKKNNSTIDFLLAGRKLTLPFFVATLVATWYGNILGVGEFIYSSGLAGWVCFSFPYYLPAILFAIFFAGKIRESNFKTIPEHITSVYGAKAGWISSLIVLLLTIPAAYILMLGIIINLFTGWALWLSIISGAFVSLAYLYTGGFKADILTNAAQFILMYLGFGILIFFIFQKHGSISDMIKHLPQKHSELFGGLSWQYVVSWYIIAFQTFIDPGFHQRCAAAKTAKTAKRGILISVGFWIIFDSLTLLAGLYAKAYYQIDNPVMAFPVIGESVLPIVWKGFFITSMLAVIMSTLDSYAFISAATIGNDILKPLKKYVVFLRKYKTMTLIRSGLVITSVLAISLAIALPSAVDLVYKTSSIGVPGLLIPLIFSFNKKYIILKGKIIIIIIFSTGISLFWTIGKEFLTKIDKIFDFFLITEPMIAGILVSLLLTVAFLRKKEVELQ